MKENDPLLPRQIDVRYRESLIPPVIRRGADLVDIVENVFKQLGIRTPANFTDKVVEQAVDARIEYLREALKDFGNLSDSADKS